jgi:hypothetical protein
MDAKMVFPRRYRQPSRAAHFAGCYVKVDAFRETSQ